MKKRPLSIVIVLIAMVLMYFGFNIDLGAFGINETLQSSTNNDNNEVTDSINDSIYDAKVNIQYNFRTDELLNSHYEKHKNEFGDITKNEYLEGANNLINQVSESVISKTEEDGDTLYFDTQTNEFSVLSTDGYIRTYFIPEDGIDYFNRK